MKILVGCLYHETNTFNPFPTSREDFVYVEGAEVLDRLACTSLLQKKGIEVVPGIYATGLSSGIVKKEAYEFFRDQMLACLDQELDGVWLHLHGSMIVEEIGSGELDLVREIRKHIGYDIPISVTLDPHANLSGELAQHINIVRSYRTVPHIDQPETECITAELLATHIATASATHPVFIPLPLVICGEKALGNQFPLNDIFNQLAEIEAQQGILTASFFLGHAWSDSEHTGASIMIVPESPEFEPLARQSGMNLMKFVQEHRDRFVFSSLALEPAAAVERSLAEPLKPLFVSDSGDNTTAGAPGGNTELLQRYLATEQDKKVLIAAIYDRKAFVELNRHEVGDGVSFQLGSDYDNHSRPVQIRGVLKAKGDLLGYLNAMDNKVGEVCTVSSGNVDIVVANSGESFITLNHFSRAGLDWRAYDVIVIKQGYLFHELAEVSRQHILALTPGATYLKIDSLDYRHIPNGKQFI
ncbi:M81 family metallopeptidase [Paenibacillus sanguinis]|uniref:M81 family metallopeptidase n=1 Tax=Paenibacillus sanguinis TaxID=225906 RepID=UPI00036F034B|nr:M81 family metallopeptidase [Paenibacillus sanguinis]